MVLLVEGATMKVKHMMKTPTLLVRKNPKEGELKAVRIGERLSPFWT